jgi:hypothetical protein
MDTAKQRYLKNMPRRPGAPPFWTLTPPRLWGIAAVGGALAVALAYVKLPIMQAMWGQQVWKWYAFVFSIITILVAFHIKHIWALVMDYDPDEIGEIPATRAQFVLHRLPSALIMSLGPYPILFVLWQLLKSLYQ